MKVPCLGQDVAVQASRRGDGISSNHAYMRRFCGISSLMGHSNWRSSGEPWSLNLNRPLGYTTEEYSSLTRYSLSCRWSAFTERRSGWGLDTTSTNRSDQAPITVPEHKRNHGRVVGLHLNRLCLRFHIVSHSFLAATVFDLSIAYKAHCLYSRVHCCHEEVTARPPISKF